MIEGPEIAHAITGTTAAEVAAKLWPVESTRLERIKALLNEAHELTGELFPGERPGASRSDVTRWFLVIESAFERVHVEEGGGAR